MTQMYTRQRDKFASGLLLSLLLLNGCGERNAKDLEEVNPAASSNSTQNNNNFVVKGSAQQPSSLNSCTIDLKQENSIDPNSTVIQANFSGKVANLKSCQQDSKTAVLYIYTPGKFEIDPGYLCRVVSGGDFNVRCAGSLVQFKESGQFDLSISGDGQFDSSKIRMRVTFEKSAQ